MQTGLAARRDQMLGRFADMALELAEQAHADAIAAETPKDRALCVRAFHTLGRALRQTFALDARLTREARQAERQASADAEIAQVFRVHRRKRQLAARVTPLIWAEHEKSDAEELEATLDELLGEDAAFEAFLERPFEAQVADLARRLGLAPPPPADPADAPSPEPALPALPDPPWRNSG